MPQSDAAEAPASDDFSQRARAIQIRLTWAKWKFIDGIHGNVVPNIEDARALVASRQFTFSGPLDSPPPTEPLLMECDHV